MKKVMEITDLPKEIQEEVSYLKELHLDSTGEELDTMIVLSDIEERAVEYNDRHWMKWIRKYMIAKGVYLVISEQEIADTIVSHGKAWDFKMDGVKYKFNRKHA